MDYNFWQSFGLLFSIFIVEQCCGYPLKSLEAGAADAADGGAVLLAAPLLLSAALFVVMVMLVVGCLCCRQTKGFQEFTDAVSTLDVSSPRTEVIPFPPLPPSEPVHFEPLPDIRPRRQSRLKPAPFAVPATQASPSHWFDGASFPRSRLHYERELGGGWFGRVVAGQAQGLGPVVVKILREEAPAEEQRLFLQQAQAYRDLRHPNVLRVIGCCLEAQPLLLLLEDCARGDLKTCLRDNPAFPENGGVLRLACDAARGLQHMLDNGFVHTDFAARNCLVTSDLRVKVGDYGNGVDRFEQDYYVAGDVAVPIRWCAPETLDCTDTTIHTKQVRAASNVWSMGVVLWEVAERGRLPYDWLSDDEVVGGVIGGSTRLPPPPKHSTPNADSLYQLMSRCWRLESERPSIVHVADMLDLLAAGEVDVEQFQRRCEAIMTRARPSADLFPAQESGQDHIALQDRDSAIESSGDMRDGARSPSTTSPQPSMASFDFPATRSDSLANLRGSVDELDAASAEHIATQPPSTPSFNVRANSAVRSHETAEFDSWLRCESTDGDSLFVREISAAIRDLDDALAQEDSTRPRDSRLARLEAAEEEMWRGRIERGEFSQKVKEKSRSVADLMVLTHIESDSSDSEASMTWSFERSSNRGSFERGPLRTSLDRGSVRLAKSGNKRSSLFGSEGDLRSAVLGEDFVASLQKIQVSRRDGKNASERGEPVVDDVFDARFLVVDASGETIGGGSGVDNTHRLRSVSATKEELMPSKGETLSTDLKTVMEQSCVSVPVDGTASVALEDDISVSVEDATCSEDPVTLVAADYGHGHDLISSTLSETSLAAPSLEELSLSPPRKPVPRPRRRTFEAIKAEPTVTLRRQSLSTEVRPAEEDREEFAELDVGGGLGSFRLESEELKTAEERDTLFVSRNSVEKVATSDLIKVAEALVNETILKSVESVKYLNVERSRMTCELNVSGVAIPGSDERTTNEPREDIEGIPKSRNESDFLRDPAVAFPSPHDSAETHGKSFPRSSVILGPCDDFTMDFFHGLKSTLEDGAHDWDSLVEESDRAAPLMKDSDESSGDYFPDLREDHGDSGEQMLDYSTLNGFAVKPNVEQLVFTASNLSLDENEFSDLDFQKCIVPESTSDVNDWKREEVLEVNDQINVTNQLAQVSPQFDSKIGEKLPDILPAHFGIGKESLVKIKPSVKQPGTEVKSFQSLVSDISNVPEKLNVDRKTADNEALPNSEWNGLVADIQLDKELTEQAPMLDVSSVVAVLEEFKPATNIAEDTLPCSDWTGSVEDIVLDQELTEKLPNISFNSKIAEETLPCSDWTGSVEDIELDQELTEKLPNISCNSKIAEDTLPCSDWTGLVEDIVLDQELTEKLPNISCNSKIAEDTLPCSDWTGSVEDIVLDQELTEKLPNISCNSKIAEDQGERTFADDRRLVTGDWNRLEEHTDEEKLSLDQLPRTEWHPYADSSFKSDDGNDSIKLKANEPFSEWTSNGSEMKNEPFSDWDGKQDDDSKQATPDDERSSDSGFRDKGSLSESCEDEKYHLEDIEAELESFQRGGHDLEADGDIVFGAEFKDSDCEVEPLDLRFLRELGDSLEGALPRVNSELDGTLVDPDVTLTPDFEPLQTDIYEPGSGSGWFLHPPESSPERSGPAVVEADFLTALRNELAEKLPNQSAPSDSESDSDCEEEPRRDVVIHYNAFQAPLSPILEEPWPESPDAFFPRTFEQEVSAALDSLESTGTDSANIDSVRLEDFDSAARPVTVRATARAALEDVLMVDIVTNEARLLDSPVPPPHLAFASRRDCQADAADATYAIRNDARSVVSDSPGSDELSFCTPAASPSRVVEISVGANDEAAMIVADLNESLGSRSLFNTCSDDYSQVSHPSLDADSSEDYSQSEDSRELDLSPVRRLDLLTLSRPATDAWQEGADLWERHMDGDDSWSSESRALQITELGQLLRCRHEGKAVAVSPDASNDMKQFVSGHRMEVNGNELKMYQPGKEPDWLDDIFNVGSPSQLSGSSSASEYGIPADEDGADDIKESLLKTIDDFEVKDDEEQQKIGADDEIGEEKCAEIVGAIMAVKEDDSESISKEEVTEIERVQRENKGADESEISDKSVKVTELVCKDLAGVDEQVESESIKDKKSEVINSELLINVAKTAGNAVVENRSPPDTEPSAQESLPSSDSSKTFDVGEVTAVKKCEVISYESADRTSAVLPPPVPGSASGAGNEKSEARLPETEEWTSMLAFTPADEHLVEMSTSFSAGDDDEEYAPDWETDSSSSGEFTWQEGETDYADDPRNSVVAGSTPYDGSSRKPYECHTDFPMESIAEEDEDEDGSEEDGSDGSGEEFVPSAWDSEATPTRSALRSPDKVSEGKKNVTFKRQKYHCVYEYPRDVTETEPAETAISDSDYFGFSDEIQSDYHSFSQEDPITYHNLSREAPVSYATFSKSAPSLGGVSGLGAVDYSSYADWELNDGDGEDHDEEDEPEVSKRRPPTQFDFYKLGAEEFGAGTDDGEFFVSSSSRPFAAFAPSQFAPSQFFPGNCFEVPPSTGDTPPASPLSPTGLGELRHTRDKLKLHLPAELPTLTGMDSKRAAPDSDDSGVGSSHGTQTPAALQV